jgi:hypothetical protein
VQSPKMSEKGGFGFCNMAAHESAVAAVKVSVGRRSRERSCTHVGRSPGTNERLSCGGSPRLGGRPCTSGRRTAISSFATSGRICQKRSCELYARATARSSPRRSRGTNTGEAKAGAMCATRTTCQHLAPSASRLCSRLVIVSSMWRASCASSSEHGRTCSVGRHRTGWRLAPSRTRHPSPACSRQATGSRGHSVCHTPGHQSSRRRI